MIRSIGILLFLSAAISSCRNNETVLESVKGLKDYPSASGMEFMDDKVYIIGDDANNILVMDTSLNIIDSISLYSFPDKRIPKDVKPDLEGMTQLQEKKLLITGSGSLAPYRNIAWIVDPATKQKDSIRLDTFYNRLSLFNIKEINIEGVAAIPGGIVLSNRGNRSNRKNQLIFTRKDFWQHQAHTVITTTLLGFNKDSNSFQGVSGLDYSRRSDRLLITVSTEDTRNSLEDGAIGKSYLWIVKNISAKKSWKAINPDQIIDLEKTDPRFKGHKIESVSVMKETEKFMYLLLAADNDDGSSSLFKVVVPIK